MKTQEKLSEVETAGSTPAVVFHGAPVSKVRSPATGAVMFVVLLALVVAGALALRLPRLDVRPMHTDEAVHAAKLSLLLDEGRYIYNPHEYHGPTLYYFTLPLLWLDGVRASNGIQSDILLRLVPVLFGVGLILLLPLIADGLGRPAALVAGVLTALSPAMVFYSRYYIQEILLVFFTFGALAAGWRYTRRKRFVWALLAGFCLGMMHATKETSVLAYASMVGAALLTALWSRQVDRRDLHVRDYLHRWHVIGTLKVAAVVAILFLTGFLSNWGAALDTVRTYLAYIMRAISGDSSTNGMGVHNHPWHYYLGMLTYFHNGAGPRWSEALILALALVGAVKVLRPRRGEQEGNFNLWRFLAFYTILMTTIYSVIPYKTPWCLLSFLHGMILLAGLGAVVLWRGLPRAGLRVGLALVLAWGAWGLGVQARRGTTAVFDTDPRNPYVYAHTTHNIMKLKRRAEQLAAVSPEGDKMVIKMIVPGADYWPLPWYLRRFANVGCWNDVPTDTDADAPLVIVSPKLQEALEARMKAKYIVEYYGLRPDVLLAAMIREDVWAKFLAAQERAIASVARTEAK